MPTAKRLSDWYKVMLNTALHEKVIRSYQVKRPNSKTEAKKSKKTKSKIRRKTPNIAPNGLKEKFLNMLEKHKNIFFVIELHPPGAGSQMSRIVDPDPSIHCDLTDTRDSFLTFCRDRNYEFSSKRRALHSTLSILIELHSSSSNAYHCNSCKKTISGVRYHCNICKDFDLCQECSTSVDHCHKLNKTIDILPSTRSPAQIANSDPTRPQARTMEDNIAEINHIVNCLDANCARDVCKQYRRVLLPHYGACKNRRNCRTCEQMTRLYTMHSRQCKNDNCNAKYCREFKNHFVNVDKQRRIRNQGLQNRRIRAMNVDTVDNAQLPSNIGTNLVPHQQQRLPSQIRQGRPRPDNNGGRGIPPYRVPSNVGVSRNGYLNYPPSHNVEIEQYKRRCPGTPYQDEYHRYRMEFDQSDMRRQPMGRPQINQHHISYMNQRPQTVYNPAGMTNYNHGQYGYPDRQNMPKIRPVMHTMYDHRNPSHDQYQMAYHVERGHNAPIYRHQANNVYASRGVPNNFNFLRSPHPNSNYIVDTPNSQMINSQNVIRPPNPGQYEPSPRVDSE
ncbi:histone lysine acetyltransferase CREBBP-like [Octopus sinensis]|uniref:histone acetyltransferase n=1 Tax=Octopus sinensis TaxID=2607531 RepID=A0A6P7U125_9MOLL|nr:histone lysine acetyltransferase CREBBP-like [Octopus sinensis]